jgi:hypothetical protein
MAGGPPPIWAHEPKLYHAGFRGVIARSTLADANEHRDWRIYADFAQVLIAKARRLYQADGFGAQLKQTAYALDSTTIDLGRDIARKNVPPCAM